MRKSFLKLRAHVFAHTRFHAHSHALVHSHTHSYMHPQALALRTLTRTCTAHLHCALSHVPALRTLTLTCMHPHTLALRTPWLRPIMNAEKLFNQNPGWDPI